ncbi:MAG: substrate-binding domain-containing protein [Pseudomonadota bacterium]|jgi:ABC-type molybdate transport system substrate-binding protein|nr:substrate-binding domain-containing protein [Pseudomonadota bacterium]
MFARHSIAFAGGLLAALLAGPAQAAGVARAAAPPRYAERLFPPWSQGANDPALHQGLRFTVPEIDDMPDFHGNLDHPALVIFVGGNYYFAMAPLVRAFSVRHPRLRGRIFYVTLPPGLLIKAMANGGTFTSGNLTFTVAPDVYAAGLKKVQGQIAARRLVPPAVPYATNTLTIMVPADNPAHIAGLTDLGRPGVRLVMPNPAWEGVARQIRMALERAGGPALARTVYVRKVADGQTILTHIHHRQTPLFLMQGIADAGVTWKSEAIFQEQIGHPLSHVDIAPADNVTAIYAAAMVRGAQHPRAAHAWLEFLRSDAAQRIFARYGFKPAPPSAAERR